jgi:hypothetical protein
MFILFFYFFYIFFQTMKNVPQSPVAVIEQAVSQSCVLISHEFQADVAKMSNGLCFFRGKLSIGSVVIGRGGDITKRKCKLEAYTNALERLKSLSVDELMESVVEIKAIPDIVSVIMLIASTIYTKTQIVLFCVKLF